jgi:hypothetical protein
VNSLLTRLLRVVVLLWASPAFSQTAEKLPTSGLEFLKRLEEAHEARSIAERLQKQSHALEAVLRADSKLLASALGALVQDRCPNSSFVDMAWARLTKLDEARALQILDDLRGDYLFEDAAPAVYGFMAQTQPERAYAFIQATIPPNKDRNSRVSLIVFPVMREAGRAWFRAEGVQALRRLAPLSHPDEMAAAVFEGFVMAATTVNERTALLDRFTSHEKPLIIEKKKQPHLCDDLVLAAAREDLHKTRAWIEKRYPAGTSRQSTSSGDWHISDVRRGLFQVWAKTDPMAAANWLMAQQGKASQDAVDSLFSCTHAIAGDGFRNMAASLAWLAGHSRREGMITVVAQWLENEPQGTNERNSRVIIGEWMSRLPLVDREAILVQALDRSYYNQKPFLPRVDDAFIARVLPDVPSRPGVLARVISQIRPEEIPVENYATSPFIPDDGGNTPSRMMSGFDVAAERARHSARSEDIELSKELERQHGMAVKADDPGERLTGLKSLRRMIEAKPSQLKAVLLAHLQMEHGAMSVFANDLIECWVMRDWRSCEEFAWKADLPSRTRRCMLVQLFREAALRFPDEVLSRLRELIHTGALSQDALNSYSAGSRSPRHLYYSCNEIIENLARGWTRQNDVEALRKIQTLPLKWQPQAFESFSDSFTTAKAGLEMLSLIVEHDGRQPLPPSDQEMCCGLKWWNWEAARPVLERLAFIAPLDAKAWLEASPERLHTCDNPFDAVWLVHREWHNKDAKAADAWLRQVRPDAHQR